jgi:NADPH:quinone reductase-like Zn-dependent oxidoreductase
MRYSTMRVYEVDGKGGFDTLAIRERDVPAPAHNQILIRLSAASLNYRDLLMVKGGLASKRTTPFVPLSDGAGQVVACGEAVKRFKTGDRVAGIFFQTWLEGEITPQKFSSALGGARDGMLAEYVVLEEDGAVKIPEHLSYEEAATLPCAAVTAWNALVPQGHLKAGDNVLIQGTGGVSVFAIQFARLFGARAIVISSSNEKLARARALGASDVINYKRDPEWDARVIEATEGRGVDHVVEVGGAETLNRSLRAVRMGGTISMIGVLTGVRAEVETSAILRKSVRVQGIYVGSREMFEEMNRAIALAELRPVVDRVFPFEEAAAALRHMESATHFGKICIRF